MSSSNRTVASNDPASLRRSGRDEIGETFRRPFRRVEVVSPAWVRMTNGQVIQVPRSLMPGTGPARPQGPSARPVVHLQLGGSGGSNPYRYGASFQPGRWVDTGIGGVQNFQPGPQTAVPVTPELQRALDLARALRPAFRRANMYISLLDLAIQIAQAIAQGWAPWNWPSQARSVVDNPGGLKVVNICEVGDIVQRECVASPNAPIPCTPTGDASTYCRPDAATYWFFGKQYILPPYDPAYHVRPRFALARPLVEWIAPNGMVFLEPDLSLPAPTIRPRVRQPVMPDVRIPHRLAVYQPALHGAAAPGRSASYGSATETDGPPIRRWPNPDVRTRPSEPPGPKVKERKARIPGWLAKAAKAAWDGTEVVDLIDALFDALPEHIQATVPRTAITSPSAFRPGVRYAGPLDRALHLYRNIHHLNISEAVVNVVVNHIQDEIIGRAMGTADRGWRRAGVSGYGALF